MLAFGAPADTFGHLERRSFLKAPEGILKLNPALPLPPPLPFMPIAGRTLAFGGAANLPQRSIR